MLIGPRKAVGINEEPLIVSLLVPRQHVAKYVRGSGVDVWGNFVEKKNRRGKATKPKQKPIPCLHARNTIPDPEMKKEKIKQGKPSRRILVNSFARVTSRSRGLEQSILKVSSFRPKFLFAKDKSANKEMSV